MAGAPYAAGGIRVTTEATRAATDRRARSRSRRAPPRRGAARGHHAPSRSSRATGSTSRPRPRSCEVAAELHRRRHVPRRPRRARRVRGPRRRLRRARLRRDARRLRAARALDRRLLRGGRVRRRPVARRARGGPRRRSRAARARATSSATGPGVQLAVELGAASVDHCTYLTDADVDALAGGDTVATFLPATDFSTRQPYPDARRVIDAGAHASRSPPTATPARATRPRWRSASRSPCATCA